MTGRWSGRGRWVAVVVVAGSVLALPGPGSAQPSPAPRFPGLPPDAPPGSGVTAPCLEDVVEGTALCGRYRVREDPEAADGRTIDLAFVVLEALDGRGGPDAVTQLNGGPGAPMTPVAASVARARAGLRRTRDILLVDHRGTGASGNLGCSLPWPGGVESRFGTVFPLDHVAACREALSHRADLTKYTTALAMDDLAALSAWLGYERLDLIGFSYASREAQVFARRHPERTRTLVLNGVAALAEPLYVHHAAYLQAALNDLYEQCEATPACREAFPDLRRVSAAVFERARKEPPEVRAEGRTVRFGAGDLGYALRGLLYGAAGRIPGMLYRAHAGDWQPLADFYLARQGWVAGGPTSPGYHFSVLCAEDVRRVSEREALEATAGTFMGDHLIAGYRGVCDLWPVAEVPPDAFRPLRGDVPTLLLSGERDPVTPPSGAEAVAAHLPNSLHVVVPKAGHGQRGRCVEAMVERLIETGSLEGIDASCFSRLPEKP